MTTANELRQYARECTESARDATSNPVRQQFLELAKLWLTTAARMDGQRTTRTMSNGHGVAQANLAEEGPNGRS
jgi:hypothetical protein